MSLQRDHQAHMVAAEQYAARHPESGADHLLYMARPSPGEPARYVWTSGVRLGLKASQKHLLTLLTAETGTMYYPDCPACGHNLSGVIGGPDNGTCTAIVPFPPGDPRGLAGYCRCVCVKQPAIRAWLTNPNRNK